MPRRPRLVEMGAGLEAGQVCSPGGKTEVQGNGSEGRVRAVGAYNPQRMPHTIGVRCRCRSDRHRGPTQPLSRAHSPAHLKADSAGLAVTLGCTLGMLHVAGDPEPNSMPPPPLLPLPWLPHLPYGAMPMAGGDPPDPTTAPPPMPLPLGATAAPPPEPVPNGPGKMGVPQAGLALKDGGGSRRGMVTVVTRASASGQPSSPPSSSSPFCGANVGAVRQFHDPATRTRSTRKYPPRVPMKARPIRASKRVPFVLLALVPTCCPAGPPITRSMACATVSTPSVVDRMDSCRGVQGFVKAVLSTACSSSSSHAAGKVHRGESGWGLAKVWATVA